MEDSARPVSEAYYRAIHKIIPEDWLLIKSVYPVPTCLMLYLLIIALGPRLMKSREPFQLTTAMRIYNLMLVLLNGLFLYYAYIYRDDLKIFFSNICMLPDALTDLEGIPLVVLGGWAFLFTKILDLLDTVFMVLRKKNSHITFLHMYHHAAMVFFTWYTLRGPFVYHGIVPVMINTFVHLIMYSYYFLATFPQLKEYLWWKRYLTTLQLVQLAFILAYLTLLYNMGCVISPEYTYIWTFNEFLFLVLFINFYVKTYIFNKPKTH